MPAARGTDICRVAPGVVMPGPPTVGAGAPPCPVRPGAVPLSNDISHRGRHVRLEHRPSLHLFRRLQPAPRLAITRTHLDQSRLLLAALPLVRTAWLELAAGRHPKRVRDDALDGRQFLAP